MSALPPAADLLRRHLAGENEAFALLMQEYQSRVYSYLVRAGVPHAHRADLFQEVFIKVHRAGSSYKEEYPFENWLFTIAANTVRSYYRSENSRSLREQSTASQTDQHADTPETLSEARETAAWLEAQIAKLPLAQREVLILCTAEKMSLKDAATVLDIPLNTAKTHLSRARQALAEQLARRKLTIAREAAK